MHDRSRLFPIQAPAHMQSVVGEVIKDRKRCHAWHCFTSGVLTPTGLLARRINSLLKIPAPVVIVGLEYLIDLQEQLWISRGSWRFCRP